MNKVVGPCTNLESKINATHEEEGLIKEYEE